MAVSDVNIPAVGKVDKKWVWIGGAGVAVLVFYYYKKNGSSSSSSSNSSQNIDPATGYPYGSAQDQAALAAQNGSSQYGAIDPSTGIPYALESGYGGYSYSGGGGGGTSSGSQIDPLTGDVAGSAQDIADLQALYGSGTPAPPASPVPSNPTSAGSESTGGTTGSGGSSKGGKTPVPVDHGPHHPKPPGSAYHTPKVGGSTRILHHRTGGQDSLNQLCRNWSGALHEGITPAFVIAETEKHSHGGRLPAKFAAYVHKGNYNAKVPAGIDLYY